MNEIENNINKIHQHFLNTLSKHFGEMSNHSDEILVHNHLPICGYVIGCDYCEKYGNILANGPVKVEDVPDMYKHVYCFNNNLKKT